MNTAGRGLGAVKYTRSQRKRLSRDRQRYIRVVESFDFSGIIQNSPVEITEGYIVSDRDSDEVFACFEFMSVSEKPIKALDVKVLLYSGQNVPSSYPNISPSAQACTTASLYFSSIIS